MASVKRDGTPARPWRVRWRDPDGRQRKKSFVRKVDADAFRARIEDQLNTGAYVDVSAARQTFQAYAEAWREAQPVRPNTRLRHDRDLRLHAYPVFGSRPIGAIRPSELQTWVTGLSGRLSPSTARVVFGTVRAVFSAAKRDRIIGHDPCVGVRLPEVERAEVWPLLVEQVELLAASIDPRFRATVAVAAGLGLRQGEVFGLQIRDVNFLRREVTVARQVQIVTGGGTGFFPTKTGKRRVVPAADVVLAELTEHLRRFRHPDTDLVFCDPKGRALHRAVFNEDVWRPARLRAAQAYRELVRREPDRDRRAELERRAEQLATCGMHDLRHFFASALIRSGLSVPAVAARMGHTTPATTLRTYSHLWPDDEDRTRQAINDMLSGKINADVPRVRPASDTVGVNAEVTPLIGGGAAT